MSAFFMNPIYQNKKTCLCVYAQYFIVIMRIKEKTRRKTGKFFDEKSRLEKKLVVLALPLMTEGEIPLIQGVRDELQRDGTVEILVQSGGYESTLLKLAEQGHLAGTIGEFMGERWMEHLLTHGVSIVQLGATTGIRIPSVMTDISAMAEEASRALLGAGITSAAYLGAPGPHDSLSLADAFALACRKKGIEATDCTALSGTPLRHFLISLPRPTGLLCMNDRIARNAIAMARETGIRVPQDLAVIGVGNSRIESFHAGIGISSFEQPLREIGHQAARMLLHSISGSTPDAPAAIRIPAILHERESSLCTASGVTRALAHLRSHPETTVSAGELARLAGMSRRSFEYAVRREQGCSPGELLTTMRRNLAEKLLRESDLKISQVGRSCGYSDAAVFSAAFRRWSGKSPRDYRSGFLT
jgi:DNA-binding LacI/PurR family transcriptional regulator